VRIPVVLTFFFPSFFPLLSVPSPFVVEGNSLRSVQVKQQQIPTRQRQQEVGNSCANGMRVFFFFFASLLLSFLFTILHADGQKKGGVRKE
jgi:hypothetical protein